MWGADHGVGKVSRALFSAYAEHVYWIPAVEEMLDYIDNDNSESLGDLKKLEPIKYVGFTKGKCASLYSTLSKGVHWEFFTSSIVMDEGTIKDSIRDMLVTVGGMSLVSHFIPTAYRSLDRGGALDSYKAFRESFQ
jgi:hypothetical protein